ncbi:hypothetical protein Dimus_018356 [Dionaea muscipula]
MSFSSSPDMPLYFSAFCTEMRAAFQTFTIRLDQHFSDHRAQRFGVGPSVAPPLSDLTDVDFDDGDAMQ